MAFLVAELVGSVEIGFKCKDPPTDLLESSWVPPKPSLTCHRSWIGQFPNRVTKLSWTGLIERTEHGQNILFYFYFR